MGFFLPIIRLCASPTQTVPSAQHHHGAHPSGQHALYAVQSQRPLLSGSVQTGKGKSFKSPISFPLTSLNPDFRGHNEKIMRTNAADCVTLWKQSFKCNILCSFWNTWMRSLLMLPFNEKLRAEKLNWVFFFFCHNHCEVLQRTFPADYSLVVFVLFTPSLLASSNCCCC